MNRPGSALIDDLSELEGQVRYHLGRGVCVRDMDYLQDGRVVAYLANVVPTDTSPWPSDAELSFVSYGPIGAAIAEPEDGGYEVYLPDRDDIHEAFLARKKYEDEHRASIVPSLLNLFEDRREMHYEEADEYGVHDLSEGDSLDDIDLEGMEYFYAGMQVGMQKMASLAHRTLSNRLHSPYEGDRRWDSPDYEVIRRQRTEDLPQRPEADSA